MGLIQGRKVCLFTAVLGGYGGNTIYLMYVGILKSSLPYNYGCLMRHSIKGN